MRGEAWLSSWKAYLLERVEKMSRDPPARGERRGDDLMQLIPGGDRTAVDITGRECSSSFYTVAVGCWTEPGALAAPAPYWSAGWSPAAPFLIQLPADGLANSRGWHQCLGPGSPCQSLPWSSTFFGFGLTDA